MSNKLLDLLRTRREELAKISASRANWSKITEWHSRTRPMIAQYFTDQLEAFDQLIVVRWAAFARVVSLGGARVDNSRTDAAERQAHDQSAQNVHARLLAHMDALIELYDLGGSISSNTQESAAIFAEVDQLVATSLLPQQFKSVVAADVRDSQLAYTAGAFKGCVVMLGAALEGVLLGTLQRADVLTFLATSTSPPGPIRAIGARDPALADKIGHELSFEDYKVCIHEMITGSDALGVDNIQSFRNAIHPWKTIQEPLKYGAFDRARALHYVGSLKKIVEAVCQWTP
jgi:hypothetical protein